MKTITEDTLRMFLLIQKQKLGRYVLGSALPSNLTQELSREITEKGLVGSTVSWDLSLSQQSLL